VVITFVASPTTSNAGPDAPQCGLIYTLAGNTPSIGTGTWTQTAGPGTSLFTNANSPTSGVTVTVAGVYTFQWTIATGAPCPDSQDDVIITFTETPTTANAGPDITTVCTASPSTLIVGNTPTVGTGTWTQTGGPVTATILSPGSPTAGIIGMTTAGTYTFRWTISNAPCTASFDEMNVVVNVSPPVPTITGGGVTVCPGTTVTLSGPIDPNYTYNWERSMGSNGAAFNSVGTGQTLNTTVSGVFRLTVTNQFGCSAISALTIVHVADYVFNGSIGAGDAQQNGRINRFGQLSTCAVPKACPGIFSGPGLRFYDAYTITNPRNTPVCATIGTNNPCGTNIFTVAYLGSFDPNNTCTNYLGDPGSSFSLGGFFEVTIPANGTIVVVVHEVNTGQGCGSYTLTVEVPRDLSPIAAVPRSYVCNGT